MASFITAPPPLASFPLHSPLKMSNPSPSPSPSPSPTSKFQTLYDLLLPGTHDSAAYKTRPDLLSRTTVLPLHIRPIRRACASVQTDFALTQTLDILSQLHAGARFLDIRVSKRPKQSGDASFWTVHGMVLCVPLAQVIEQINQFHRQTEPNPQFVVSVFRAYSLDREEEIELATFVTGALQHSCFEGDNRQLRQVPVSCLPRNIVAGLHGAKLSMEWGQDAWLDTNSAERKVSFLDHVLQSTKHRHLRNDLFVFGWTVTPSVFDITMRVLSLGTMRPAVKVEAVKMNARFDSFLNLYGASLAARVNVVFFDCFTQKLAQVVHDIGANSSETDDSVIS